MLKHMRIEMQHALTLYNTKFLSQDFSDKIAIVFNHKLQELKVDDARLLAQYINSDVTNTKFSMYYKFEPNKETEYIVNNLDTPLKDYFYDQAVSYKKIDGLNLKFDKIPYIKPSYKLKGGANKSKNNNNSSEENSNNDNSSGENSNNDNSSEENSNNDNSSGENSNNDNSSGENSNRLSKKQKKNSINNSNNNNQNNNNQNNNNQNNNSQNNNSQNNNSQNNNNQKDVKTTKVKKHKPNKQQPKDNKQQQQPKDNKQQQQPKDNKQHPPKDNKQHPPKDNKQPPKDNKQQPRDNKQPPRDNKHPPRDNKHPPKDNKQHPPRDNKQPPRDNKQPPRDNKPHPVNTRSFISIVMATPNKCINKTFCKMTKKQLCIEIARNYIVRSNIIQAIMTALNDDNAYCNRGIENIKNCKVCLPPNYDTMLSIYKTPEGQSNELLKYIYESHAKFRCDKLNGIYKEVKPNKQKLKSSKNKYNKLFGQYKTKLIKQFKSSIYQLNKILNMLYTEELITNADLNKIGLQTKNILDTMYSNCKITYLFSVVAMLQSDAIPTKKLKMSTKEYRYLKKYLK